MHGRHEGRIQIDGVSKSNRTSAYRHSSVDVLQFTGWLREPGRHSSASPPPHLASIASSIADIHILITYRSIGLTSFKRLASKLPRVLLTAPMADAVMNGRDQATFRQRPGSRCPDSRGQRVRPSKGKTWTATRALPGDNRQRCVYDDLASLGGTVHGCGYQRTDPAGQRR